MRWLVFATALLANPGNSDLGGNALYLDGQGRLSNTRGVLNGTTFNGSRRVELVIPPATDSTDPRVMVGVGIPNGDDQGNGGPFSGFTFGDFGDTGIVGCGSTHICVLNTVATDNDATFELGGGSRNKQGDAFQFFNVSRFGSEVQSMQRSSGVQSLVHMASGINQTGSAKGRILFIEAGAGTLGSGGGYLIDAGTNSGTDSFMSGANVESGLDESGYTSKFVVKTDGKVGILTGVPTHTLTLGNTGTWASYNTADQTVNYERIAGFWQSNVYIIQSQKGGSGTSRAVELVSNDASGLIISDGGAIQLNGSSAGYTFLQVSADTVSLDASGRVTTANQPNVRLRNVASSAGYSSSNGLQQGLQIPMTVAQSGSGAFTGVEVNVTESSVGSGAKLLFSGIVAAASKFSVDDNGVIATAGATTGTNQVGAVFPGSVAFVSLSGAATNGQLVYCSNCTIANPCASGGTGAMAKRLNGVWVCN